MLETPESMNGGTLRVGAANEGSLTGEGQTIKSGWKDGGRCGSPELVLPVRTRRHHHCGSRESLKYLTNNRIRVWQTRRTDFSFPTDALTRGPKIASGNRPESIAPIFGRLRCCLFLPPHEEALGPDCNFSTRHLREHTSLPM